MYYGAHYFGGSNWTELYEGVLELIQNNYQQRDLIFK